MKLLEKEFERPQRFVTKNMDSSQNFKICFNLVSRASFPLTSGRETRALGAAISGMRIDANCALRSETG